MKERFTPGPWAVWSCFRKKNGKLPVVHDESGDTVTICEVIDDKEHPEIADADAALIAAAPEMYEFIRWIRSVQGQCAIMKWRKFLPEILDKADEILHKAEGEE